MESQKGKCDDKSKQFLIEGDDFSDKSQYFEALISFNKSLCNSPLRSKNIGIAFARRSDVYFKLKKLELCVENIKLARQHGFSVDDTQELVERERKCEIALEEQKANDDSPWNYFKLSHPPNKKIPFIADCLKLHETWKYGRCVITTRSLHAGDVVAIEQPLFKIINKGNRFSRCGQCIKSNMLSLIPCPGRCTSSKF